MDALLLALVVALGCKLTGAPWWGAVAIYFAALASFRIVDAIGLIREAGEKQITVQVEMEGREPERYVPLWVAPPGDDS